MVAWGPIIGAGISVLGSLFGDDDEKETRTTVDYQEMARSAEKAGYNPLTAIRNGGSAGFVTTHHPALSSADRFGQAFATLGNALMSFDARADERAALEDRLMQAQIGALNRSNYVADRMMAMDVPSAAGSTRQATPSPALGTRENPAPAYVYVKIPETDQIVALPNPEFVSDPETLTTIPAAGALDRYKENVFGPPADTQRNWRKLGEKIEKASKPTVDPRGFANDVKEWFKPWEGVFW